MNKIAFGVPFYGTQAADWWVPLLRQAATLYKQDIEFIDILPYGSMSTAKNRNRIARDFLDSTAEWLFWIDTDNINPIASIRRLLDINHTLVGGLYFSKTSSDKHSPIAYRHLKDGRYESIGNWVRGEIVECDAAGMDCILTHRSVFEDIDKNYVALQFAVGGITLVHRDDIEGDIFDNQRDSKDGKVVDGVLHNRLQVPQQSVDVPFFQMLFGSNQHSLPSRWRMVKMLLKYAVTGYHPQAELELPFFMLRNNRTEDIGFFERARRVGHKLLIDTSIECGHLKLEAITGKDYREKAFEEMLNESPGNR